MLKLFDVSYEELKKTRLDELYQLRKQTFSDRLGWDVVCNHDMEFDNFDNAGTRYILGVYQDQLICSVRFIGLERPNMITHTFKTCFNDILLPDNGMESSRFFVDKARTRQLLGESFPVSQVLFLAMINYARDNNLAGIHAIVSRAMLKILQRSGWNIEVLKTAHLTPREPIYLVHLAAGKESQLHMAKIINTELNFAFPICASWPLLLAVTVAPVVSKTTP